MPVPDDVWQQADKALADVSGKVATNSCGVPKLNSAARSKAAGIFVSEWLAVVHARQNHSHLSLGVVEGVAEQWPILSDCLPSGLFDCKVVESKPRSKDLSHRYSWCGPRAPLAKRDPLKQELTVVLSVSI